METVILAVVITILVVAGWRGIMLKDLPVKLDGQWKYVVVAIAVLSGFLLILIALNF
ncbi:hypothetical protein [Halobacillus litoralis]|uniref:hypothetical protein n=1 Tax=Halobacillus litoralis TaxID=45668 RepID=UPI001CD4B194|nr:hypothetical protein [Halobacillus litoralis]MCA1023698.1 hypothetical protein [Halobacillus litoralis]